MKRVISLLLSIALMLALAACAGPKSPTPDAAQPEPAAQAPTERPAEADAAEEEAKEEPAAEEDAASEDAAEEDVSAQEAIGSYEDGVYDNEMLGIQASFDETWYIATAEERLQLTGAVSEVIADEAIAQSLEESGTAMDLYALQATGNSVNLMLQKVSLFQSVLVTEQQYVEQSLSELPAAMESIQVENAQIEAIPVNFAGEEHAGISITGTQNSMDFHEKMVVIKAGGYFALVTAACYGEDVTDDILSLFTAK